MVIAAIAATVVTVPRAASRPPKWRRLRATRTRRRAIDKAAADHGSDKGATMQAIEIKQPGGPDVLQAVQRPEPQPRAGELLIAVSASGINRPDVLQRKGLYPMPPGVSDLPGLEIAGTVRSGSAEDLQRAGLKIGDRVCALVAGGGYAQLCVAPAGQCLPVPKGLSDIEAAALPETFFTVWQNLFQNARLKRGETLLVQGGSSGIGVTAIHLAKAFGVRIIVTAGSDEKCAACIAEGADHAINYKTQDFVAEVKRFTDGRGVDVVLDMVAGDYLAREVECMADDGRIAIIAVQGGTKAALDVGSVLRRRLSIIGSTLRPRSIDYKTVIARELREQVWPLIEAGKIKPVIYKVFPAAQAAQAHALMESSVHVGKIVLDWSAS
jgi:NADPH2:quinone reductase